MRVRFVSPWYPDEVATHAGIFVAQQVSALRSEGMEIWVEVPQIFPAPPGPIPPAVHAAMTDLARRTRSGMFYQRDQATYVPAAVPARSGYVGRSSAIAASLRILRAFHDDKADVAHAHLGVPTGWAVSQTSPDLPLVVTEHQSTIEDVLSEDEARSHYEELLRSADAFICVSDHLKGRIVDRLGDWASEQIEVVPNIVDLTGIRFRERTPNEFQAWIYVGGLADHKGVRKLIRAFADYRRRYDPEATLSLVGQGPLEGWISSFARRHRMSRAISLRGVVSHDELGTHLDEADVFVHLSPSETFGIAPLEAIGAGLPVVSLRNEGFASTWGRLEEVCGAMLPLGSSPREVSRAVADLRAESHRLDLRTGRAHIESSFSAPVIAGRLKRIYTRVLR